jgi:hypothetical protein
MLSPEVSLSWYDGVAEQCDGVEQAGVKAVSAFSASRMDILVRSEKRSRHGDTERSGNQVEMRRGYKYENEGVYLGQASPGITIEGKG